MQSKNIRLSMNLLGLERVLRTEGDGPSRVAGNVDVARIGLCSNAISGLGSGVVGLLLALGLVACKPSAPQAQGGGAPMSSTLAQSGPEAAAATSAPVSTATAPIGISEGKSPQLATANDGAVPTATVAGSNDTQQLASADERRRQGEDVLRRVGKVAIGDQMESLKKWSQWTTYSEELNGCQVYSGSALPEAIEIMTWDNVVVRYGLVEEESRKGQQVGPFGLRNGMARTQVVALLPDVPASGADDYNGEAGEYLTWLDPYSDLGIRLEMLEGKLIGMYWGKRDAIGLAEGCA